MTSESTLDHLQAIRKEPKGKHTATVVLLHGLGDSGRGWQNLADDFGRDPRLQGVKFVFPHAPMRPLTLKQGMPVPSWFDILSFDITSAQDEPGMLRSLKAINALISDELEILHKAVGADGAETNTPVERRLVLGGFSQGGTISLLAGLNSERHLGGIFILSGRLALPKPRMQELLSPHVTSTPIFWGHGTADTVVQYSYSQDGVAWLTSPSIGITKNSELNESGDLGGEALAAAGEGEGGLTYKSYEGCGHTLDPRENEDLKEWLVGRVGGTV